MPILRRFRLKILLCTCIGSFVTNRKLHGQNYYPIAGFIDYIGRIRSLPKIWQVDILYDYWLAIVKPWLIIMWRFQPWVVFHNGIHQGKGLNDGEDISCFPSNGRFLHATLLLSYHNQCLCWMTVDLSTIFLLSFFLGIYLNNFLLLSNAKWRSWWIGFPVISRHGHECRPLTWTWSIMYENCLKFRCRHDYVYIAFEYTYLMHKCNYWLFIYKVTQIYQMMC